jgi:acetoacetyl-CoA synthetase
MPEVLPEPLWRPNPERIERAGITRFLRWLERERGRRIDGYEALWQWSVDDLEGFWAAIWDFCGVISHTPYERVLGEREMPHAQWFPGASVNYAEHMLAWARRPDADSRVAVVFESELRPRIEITWSRLAADTGALAATLARLGVARGDRVVGYLPNVPESLIAMLATTSLGAIWSGCSPDMGATSVLDRYRQIEPTVLIAVDGYRYGGRDFDRRAVIAELVAQLPTLRAVILVPALAPEPPPAAIEPEGQAGRRVPVTAWAQALAQPAAPRFEPVPFDHPLWIVYSSGTTGMPKPIVHGHGGTVLETLKSCLCHLDVGEDDRFFWYSSTNWIMWNLWASTLMTGCTVIQFDGNPGHPDLDTLWRLAARERITFFGVSPAFIALNMKAGIVPRERHDLSAMRTLGATGSPLTEEAYQWIYRSVGDDLLLASISGGTDPGSAFLTSCPILPIRAGEMQCRGLGIGLRAYGDDGQPRIGEVGELVCETPLPSMPLFFWNDPGGRRYFESYFETFPGPPNVWRHGDWLRLIARPESVTGIVYGRSDSTINRHGIRMGTSELYRVVEDFDAVLDSLVIDLEYLGRESWMALFVVLREPAAEVPAALKAELLAAIRTRLSARHAPNEVFAIPEVPRTISGKKMEVPVKRILLGHPAAKVANRDSMANPGSIDWFVAFATARSTAAGPAAATAGAAAAPGAAS